MRKERSEEQSKMDKWTIRQDLKEALEDDFEGEK